MAQQQGIGFRGGPGRNMGAPTEKPANMMQSLKRLFSYFGSEKFYVFLLIFCVSAGVLCGSFAPRMQSNAIDAVVRGSYELLPRFLITMLVLYILNAGAALLQGLLSARLSRNIVKKLRGDLFDKIVHLPVRYLDGHSHGDLMSRMTNDAENVSGVISQSLSSLFSGVLTLIVTLIMMLSYNVLLTLLTCSTVLLTLAATRFLSAKMRLYYVKRQELLGKVNSSVEEMVTNCRTVTAYNLQDASVADFEVTSDALKKTGIIADIIGNAMGPVMNTLSNITFVIVAVFGAVFAIRGYISVGVISAFIIYSKQFSRPINELAQLYGQIATALAGAERIFAVLDEKSEDFSGQPELTDVRGIVEFKHVNFSYEPGKQVIYDFNLRVEAGKKIALVGSTGCGKTTIVNLLMRFYDPDSGSITVDGKDITKISRHALRDAIGIVLQDAILFSDTVRANLKYADASISDEKMLESAQLACCDTVADALPEGYDSFLTSAGAGLSQGQKQLLTIGRAFLSYPYILILDEATSSVDTRTEQNIQDAMARLMKGRTSLIIAHRLSTILDADQIVVMDKGHIVETGTHSELLARKGQYYSLYMTQFAGRAT